MSRMSAKKLLTDTNIHAKEIPSCPYFWRKSIVLHLTDKITRSADNWSGGSVVHFRVHVPTQLRDLVLWLNIVRVWISAHR